MQGKMIKILFIFALRNVFNYSSIYIYIYICVSESAFASGAVTDTIHQYLKNPKSTISNLAVEKFCVLFKDPPVRV